VSATMMRDYEGWEIASAVLISAAIQLAAGVVLWVQRPTLASAPEIDKSALTPVRVIPVADLDMAAPKLGGGKPSALPDMWQRASPSVRKAAEERVATKAADEIVAPTTKASEDAKDAPDPKKRVESADTAKPAASTDEPPKPESSAAPEAVADAKQDGAQEGQVEGAPSATTPTLDATGGTSNAPPGPGCSGPECSKDGKLDDFQRRQYAARLVAHVKRGGFVVTGSPLPDEELKKLRVSAVIQLSGTTITGYSMSPSGDAACDAAARAKLDGAKGSDVPPPPEDHPEFLQPSYSVTFACAR
jgi:hypothetical protein